MTIDAVNKRIEAHLNGTKRILAERQVAGETIVYAASAVRNERTGVHARLDILVHGVTLAWDRMNVEKEEDRVRLAGKAIKGFGPLVKDWPRDALEKDLRDFADQVWPEWLKANEPEWMAGAVERRRVVMLVEDLVVRGGGTIIFGPPGRGKSYLLLAKCVSVNHGINQVFGIPEAVPSLYINLERSRESMQQRLGNVNEALGLDRDEHLFFLNARGRSLSDVYDAVDNYIQREGIGYVVLDSISRAGYGDLTENQPVNRIVDGLNGLCPTWTGIAHTPRGDDTHAYGSIHFDAGADVTVQLRSQHKDASSMGILLNVQKENDIGGKPQLYVGMGFDEKGLRTIWRAKDREFPELAAEKPQSDRGTVIDYLLMVGEATATQIAKATGLNRTVISHLCANDPELLRRPSGKEVYYSVKL